MFCWRILNVALFLTLSIVKSITVSLNPFLLFFDSLGKLAEYAVHTDNLNPDIVNMFMICDDFDANPYPGVYIGKT